MFHPTQHPARLSRHRQHLAPGAANGIARGKPPKHGVGAVIVQDARVALIKRAHPPLVGEWSLPGGAVETGERLEDAIIREVFEETGLQITVDSLALIFERIMPDAAGKPEYHYVLLDYLCRRVGGTLAAAAPRSQPQ